jgi:hypothetical protein
MLLIKMAAACGTQYREMRTYIFGGKTMNMRFIRLTCRWECNVEGSVQETGLGDVEWIDLVQYGVKCRVVLNTVMKLLFSQNVGYFSTR